jgi:hypothetical protein
MAAAAQNQTGPNVTNQYTTQDLANTNADLDRQQSSLQDSYRRANGLAGPSVAQQQVAQNGQRAASTQYALANGLGGSAGALAHRNAVNQANTIGINTSNTSNMIGAQERAAAQQQYTNALAGYRQQGQGAQAGAQQLDEAQGQINTQQNNINDQSTLGWQQLAQSAEQAQLQGDSSVHNANVSAATARALANQQAQANMTHNIISGAGGVVTGLVGVGIASDERLKSGLSLAGFGTMGRKGGEARHNTSEGTKSGQRTLTASDIGSYMSDERAKVVRPGGETEADRFLSTMQPYSYSYKDPANEPTDSPNGGRYLGVMAQNLERGPTGDTIVKDTPRGKMLEGPALMSAMAAGEGRLNERLSSLEAQLSGMKGKR